MKKLIGLLLAGLLSLGWQDMQAQSSDYHLLNMSTIGIDKPAIRAARDFWQRAGETKGENWYKMPAGYMAFYQQGLAQGRYYYNKRGYWLYSLLTYSEKDLPAEVRRLIRSTYYDYSITWAKEIDQPQSIVYVAHIENGAGWEEIAVQDGEMQVLKAFCK
jgi:hypothetical protein